MLINAADFGLKGESKYKDTKAIQKALNYAKHGNIPYLYLKALTILEKR